MDTSAEDVFAAIKTAWGGAASLAAIDGPYRDQADGTESFPYCVVVAVGNQRQGASSTSEYWRHVVEFTVYDTTPELCEAHVGAIGAVFDPLLPTLAAGKGSINRTRRTAEESRKEDRQVWKASITYDFLRTKPK